jgi:hypothetical protein
MQFYYTFIKLPIYAETKENQYSTTCRGHYPIRVILKKPRLIHVSRCMASISDTKKNQTTSRYSKLKTLRLVFIDTI